MSQIVAMTIWINIRAMITHSMYTPPCWYIIQKGLHFRPADYNGWAGSSNTIVIWQTPREEKDSFTIIMTLVHTIDSHMIVHWVQYAMLKKYLFHATAYFSVGYLSFNKQIDSWNKGNLGKGYADSN